MTETIVVRSLDGLKLEAEIDFPETLGGALLLCHPHPQMGGTMNAPLLLALRDRLVAAGWGVLRFNYRGIGSSEGDSGTGGAEEGDARGALARLREACPGAPLVAGGWSFGAGVAIRILSPEPDLEACVAIAPSVRGKDDVTIPVPPASDIQTNVPILVVCGERDDQVSPADARAWAEDVPSARYVEMPGANHFFWGRYDQLADTVASFLDEIL
jgi:alpha/beta superfamily hydrolase